MYRELNWVRQSESAALVNNRFTVEVAQGDITDEKVEAIVNPANEKLGHSGGCAAAIQREAGSTVMIESSNYVRVHGEIPVGQCTFTSSGKLGNNGVKYIIHTVGP